MVGSRFVRRTLALAASAAMLGVLVPPAVAQENTGRIQGRVVAEGSGQPLNGVQIFVPGTGLGTLTNDQGRFMILNVPAGSQTVRAQFIGYGTAEQSVTVQADEVATVNFELGQSAIALDEVIVTGTGVATEKRKLGNTVGSIDAGQLEAAPISDVSEMLSGREPGVISMASGGLVGEGAQIRIRGSASLTQSNEPIVYIDGVRVDGAGGFAPGVGAGGGGTPSRLGDINPDAIERIEVLKGAAAATLYGTEASNGVIQIFTKSGYSGDPRWTFELEQGFLNYPAERYKPNAGFAIADTATIPGELGYRFFGDIGADALGEFAGRDVAPYEVVEQNFVTDLFETSPSTTLSGQVSGGNSLVTYFLSGRYQRTDGPQAGQELGPASDEVGRKQGSMTVNIFPTEDLRVRVNSLYSESRQAVPNNNNNIYGVLSLAMFGKPEHAFCNDPSTAVQGFECRTSDGEIASGNPKGQVAFMTVREAYQTTTTDDAQNFVGSVNANYSLMDNITLDGTFGLNFVNQRSVEFSPYGHDVDDFSTGYFSQGQRSLGERNHREISFDGKASWNTDFTGSINSQFVLGSQVFYSQTKTAGGFGFDFPAPGLEVVSAAAVKDQLFETFLTQVNAGVFGQEQIGWNDWAFFTVGGRYDQHSAFGETAGGQFYPKASASFDLSGRPGWNAPLGISTLRIRSAIGRSGLQPGAFAKFTTYSALPTGTGAGIQPSNLGNQDLEPEVTTEWEVGTDVAFFNDRLGLDLTYWDRVTDEALYSRQFPVTGGFTNQQTVNIGEMVAHGVEIGVDGLAYAGDNVTVNLFANGAYTYQEVTDLGGAPSIKVGGSYPRYRNFVKEGYAPGALFGARVLDVPDGQVPYDTNGDGSPDTEAQLAAWLQANGPTDPGALAGDYLMLADDNKNGVFLDEYLGKPWPDWEGAFGGDISYGAFSFSTMFEYKARNFGVTNLTDAFRRSNPVIGRNTPKAAQTEATLLNPASTDEELVAAAKTWAYELQGLSPFSGLNTIEDGDFIRWREASLTYNFPGSVAQRVGASNLALTLTGRNLFLWTGYSGIDPELNVFGRGGSAGINQNFGTYIDAFGYPLPRRLSVNVRVGF